MEKLKENPIKIASSGAQGGMFVQQQMQLNEERSPINLLELPRELLEEILIYLDDDKQLLAASHVCKLFASVVETVFARKYSDELYGIYNEDDTEMAFHKVILEKYGHNIRDILIFSKDEGLLGLVEEKCCNLKRLSLNYVPKIIMVKNVKDACLCGIRNLTREQFTEFINKNHQIEDLELGHIKIDLLDLLDGRLNKLRTLNYCHNRTLTTHLPKIQLSALETAYVTLKATEDYVRFLQAMNGNSITKLHLCNKNNDGDSIINAICSFRALTSLQLPYYAITKDQIRKLAQHLPDLTALYIKSTENGSKLEGIIHFTLSMFPKLTELAIDLDKKGSEQFSSQSKKSIYEFHGRLGGATQ